jgi:hypothetical protein
MVKKIAFPAVLVVCSLLATLALLEMTYRLYQLAVFQAPLFGSRTGTGQRACLDPELGWRNNENYFIESVLEDAGGNKYTAKVTTGQYGFKLFPHHKGKTNILLVGDSFTDANEVSNDKTYWAVLAEKLNNLNLFVYGCGGYGNLQEFMIIDKYFDEIKPRIILLQLCINDFINNDFYLEYNSNRFNNGNRRPYLNAAGELFYRNPKHLTVLPELLLANSRLFLLLNFKAQIIFSRFQETQTIENAIEKTGRSHPAFRQAADITAKIFNKIKERAPGVKIYAFCVDGHQPYYDEFRDLTGAAGFVFIDGIPQALRAAEGTGRITWAADRAHWNEFGNRVVGEKLAEYFRQHGFDLSQ